MTKVKDITGLKFNKLKVLSFYDSEMGDSRWLCQCECNEERIVYGYNLKNGIVKACHKCSRKTMSEKKVDKSLLNAMIGCLSVIKYAGTDKAKNSRWLVKCNICKKEKIVLALNLKKNKPIQCSCIKRKQEKKYKDITGEKYGYLKVISYFGSSKKGDAFWNVFCENCGGDAIILGAALRRGRAKSCGCTKESFVAIECKKYFKENYKSISEYNILINPKTGHFLPYDIFIPKYNAFIEIQGEQHYAFAKRWHGNQKNFEYQKKKDRMKKKYAIKNGIYISVDLRKIKTPEKAIEYISKFL